MKLIRLLPVAGLLAASAFLPFALRSQQDPQPESQPDDPPGRVARLNWFSGDVSFQPAGIEDWTAATLNYPLSTSDHLFTSDSSRVEMHIGPNAIRLDANSNFGFLNLSDSMVQVSLTEGSMEVRLRALDDGDAFEIATPNGAVTLLRTGDYRIDTDPGLDATMLTVRGGQAELYSGSDSVIIRTGETAYFQTDQNPDVRSANPDDDFDAFTEKRDYDPPARRSDAVPIPNLVAEGVTGAEDLSTTGTWENTAAYGPAWVPPVDPSWTPYSDGDWTYIDPWGWTWIDAAPWGFAPFHYGRWSYQGSRWVWVPDRAVPGRAMTARVYAPALVTFIGGGPASGVSWFPLAPRDIWVAPWKAEAETPLPAPSAVDSRPPRPSANRLAPGAIHTLSASDFVSGGRVRPVTALIPEGQVLGSDPCIAPVRESMLVGTLHMRPPARVRPLIARTAPPAAPVAFSARAPLLAENHGRPLAPSQLEALRQLPAAVVQRPVVRYTVPLVNTPRSAPKAVPARPGIRANQ